MFVENYKMEPTVTISLEKYESLKSKADILDSSTVYFCYKECMPFNNWIDVKTNDPVIAKIKKEVEDFRENFKEFQKRKNKEQRDLCVYGEIQKVKKMSLIQFIKWRKSK